MLYLWQPISHSLLSFCNLVSSPLKSRTAAQLGDHIFWEVNWIGKQQRWQWFSLAPRWLGSCQEAALTWSVMKPSLQFVTHIHYLVLLDDQYLCSGILPRAWGCLGIFFHTECLCFSCNASMSHDTATWDHSIITCESPSVNSREVSESYRYSHGHKAMQRLRRWQHCYARREILLYCCIIVISLPERRLNTALFWCSLTPDGNSTI